MAPVKMTREEYQKKYGTAPVASATSKSATPVKMTRAEYTLKYGGVPDTEKSKPAEEPGYLERVGNEIKGAFQSAKKTTVRGAELMQEGKVAEGALMSGLGAPAAFLRGAFSPVTAAVAPLVKKGIEASGIAENETFQKGVKKVSELAAEHPDVAENIKNALEIAGAITGTKGAATAFQGAKEVTKKAAGEVGGAFGRIAEPIVKTAKTTGAVISDIAQGASRIPSRIATNVAERQAAVQTIKKIPSQLGQRAAQEGIDVPDIGVVLNLSKNVKPAARELADTVIKYAKRETDVEPISMVGKPIVARLKELDSIKSSVGQQLGEVANSLPKLAWTEIEPIVFEAVKKVPGMSGLTINKNGILNFKNTVLASVETASDRKAIQSIFTNAIKSGTGKQKHMLRQELFEVLGGKKMAGVPLTDTQAKVFDAIRKGLSDVLETKNNTYKLLSNQYRKAIQPLSAIRKRLSKVPGATEDVLDMNAGLLARRLTSTSVSQGDIMTILKALDEATDIKGNLAKNVTELQKFYNVLDRYYDIAPKTGFQGQVRAGIEGARGVGDLIAETARGIAGQTPAVRQKALEDLLKEVLGETAQIPKKGAFSPKGPGTKIIKTDPLIQEAKKYKSAEEFVKAQGTQIKSSKEIIGRGFVEENKLLPFNERNLDFRASDLTIKDGKVVIYRASPDGQKLLPGNYVSLRRYTETSRGSNKEYLIDKADLSVDKDSGFPIYTPRKSNLTKSQLTDIWNKANKKAPRGAFSPKK